MPYVPEPVAAFACGIGTEADRPNHPALPLRYTRRRHRGAPVWDQSPAADPRQPGPSDLVDPTDSITRVDRLTPESPTVRAQPPVAPRRRRPAPRNHRGDAGSPGDRVDVGPCNRTDAGSPGDRRELALPDWLQPDWTIPGWLLPDSPLWDRAGPVSPEQT